MKVLIACEESDRVRSAFAAIGHDAWSCDLQPSRAGPRHHIQDDVLNHLDQGWDLMIAHPECRYLCLSGVRWLYHPDDTHLPAAQRRRHPEHPHRMEHWHQAIADFKALQAAPIDRICIENSQPTALTMKEVGRYDQIIQPWMFGDPHTKGAALWLKNLPLMQPYFEQKDYAEIRATCHRMAPGPDRSRIRAETSPAIAQAFAAHWGNLTST